MTFANGLARGIALTALALGSMGVVNAQNGSNYHVLSNGVEVVFGGIGAGGTQTALDGLGVFIPGEDVRGSLLVDPDGAGALLPQFCYRQVGFRETWCIFTPGVISGLIQRQFAGLYFIELDGLNANNNVVFTRPVCTTPITASFLAYGTGPSSTASFVLAATSALGQTVLLPNNGLVPAGSGTATQVAVATVAPATIASGCYVSTFFWAGSAIPYLDNIDALWHYTVNSPDLNQYWAFSEDEMNLTRSNTVVTDNGLAGGFLFDSVLDYSTHQLTKEAQTQAILGPHGIQQDGAYYAQTENMAGGGGPNFGFDVGRGSRAISFSGLGGVKVSPALGGLGNGAQDPAYDLNPPSTKTLGFATWDNKPNTGTAGVGSTRLTWISIDLAQIGGLSPELDPDIKKGGGTVRLPVIGTGFIQPITSLCFSIFGHQTKAAPAGWPDPEGGAGIGVGAAGVNPIAGGSIQFNVGPFVAKVPCTGTLPVNLTYGTTGQNHFPPPALTWDPSNADISGSKELYLWK